MFLRNSWQTGRGIFVGMRERFSKRKEKEKNPKGKSFEMELLRKSMERILGEMSEKFLKETLEEFPNKN